MNVLDRIASKGSSLEVIYKDEPIVTVADPFYLEEESHSGLSLTLNEVKLSKYVDAKGVTLDEPHVAKSNIYQEETVYEYKGQHDSYKTLIANILIVPKSFQSIFTLGETLSYYPTGLKAYNIDVDTDVSLGCDTARFIMNIINYDEFRTGADGYYGQACYVKHKDQIVGAYINISMDSDIMDYDTFKQKISYVLGL